MSSVVNHWINGAEYVSKSGRTFPVYDPALGVETKKVALANQEEIALAIKAARDAFPAWRDTSLAKRQQIIFSFRELLNARKGELAEIITSEHGKVLSDALGEITRGQEVVEFAVGIPHLLKGYYSENVSTGVDVYSTRQPLGVVGIISPFNFPAMVPMWFFPIAIASGNTVVMKPSEKDPSASMWIAQLWKDAGLPDGVFNVLNGDKESVDGLIESPDVQSISFVGSTPIAKYIYENSSKHGKRVQALGGAKNHMLVLPDADLELVADSAINAGFGSAGERCMAISVVVAVEPVADQLIEKIVSRMGKLVTGDGRRGCDMGPLVTREHRDKVASYIEAGEKEGAKIAREILTEVGLPAADVDEICNIIDGHDTRHQPISVNDSLVKDADKIWRVTPHGRRVVNDWFGLNNEQSLRLCAFRAYNELFTDAGRAMSRVLVSLACIDQSPQLSQTYRPKD